MHAMGGTVVYSVDQLKARPISTCDILSVISSSKAGIMMFEIDDVAPSTACSTK